MSWGRTGIRRRRSGASGPGAEVPIGTALLDQRILAGPGNVYRSEICFLRGLDPRRPVASVVDLRAVVDLTKRLMEANRATGQQVTTGDLRPGRGRWVYGRRGAPCLRCGSPVERFPLEELGDERVAYRCPTCQP